VSDRRDHVWRPRRHGYGSEATHRCGPGHLYSGDLRSRRSRRYQRAASFFRPVRADRIHHGPAENTDAGPDAPMAAHDGAGVCLFVRDFWRAELDRAPSHAPPKRRGRAHMNWTIRLTWWDKLLLTIMTVGAVFAFVRFATGIGTIANINNAYPWG